MRKAAQICGFPVKFRQKWTALATKVTRAAQLGEASLGDRSFGAREQRFNGFVRHQVNLLVGCPSVYGQCDQLLILPGGAPEDGVFQRMQRQTQLGGLAAPDCFHSIFDKSKDRANFTR